MAKSKPLPSADKLIKNYILNGLTNGKQAAIDANYSPKTAEQSASRVLRGVKAKEAIKHYQEMSNKSFIWSKEEKLLLLEKIARCATETDPDKGMVNMQSAIAALKEHNLMQGDNAPTESTNTLIIDSGTDEW